MRHVTVYQEKGVYAGWPANHGAWQWGDEILVGFMRGRFKEIGMHNILEPFEKVQARSLDGGETWSLEAPGVDFECKEGTRAPPPAGLDLARGDIIRVCGNYDHGGEYCAREGGFYWSRNRGRTWTGPYSFGLKVPSDMHVTARTCVLGGLVFLSMAFREHWGSDFVVCAMRNPDGSFGLLSTVCADEARCVMPAVARLSGGRIVAATRRRGTSRRMTGWIDAQFSDSNGIRWSEPLHVADTGTHNGNPPALIESDGMLYCAYANRTDKCVWVSVSDDQIQWHAHTLLRKGECGDVGYPRLFKRHDGQLVCVYYWSDYGEEQRIEATIF